MSIAFVDLEANGLLYDATKVHCVCFITDKGTEHSFTSIQEALAALDEFDTVVAHNGSGYDFPLLKKLFSWEHSNTIDTMIYSRLYEPDRFGGHSIEQYAKEFGMTKVGKDITDWSTLTDEMLDRCLNDARVGKKVFEVLNSRMTNEWREAIDLETRVAEIHAQQVLNGVLFDMGAAETLAEELEGVLAALEREILVNIPLKAKKRLTTITAPFKMDGSYKKSVLDWYGEDCDFVFGDFNRVEFEALNLNSPLQVKDYLITQGWKPTEHTKLGSPRLTEDSYQSIKGELGQMIARRNVVKHRRGMIKHTNGKGEKKGFVYMVRDDGRIEADGFPLGTPTARYIHKNVVNVPKADPSVPYGKEIRSLFIAEEGKVLLGSDANSLEAVMEAHYCTPFDSSGEYIEALIKGDSKMGTDIHTRNAAIWEVPRSIAKNGKYALTYGCSPTKLASTLGKKKKEGKKYYDAFWDGNTALRKLNKLVKDAAKNGYVRGIDGRKIWVRSDHSALNALFQSAGSITVKVATVLMNERLNAAGYDWKQVGHWHDEVLFEILPEDANEISEVVLQCWIDAGKSLNLNVPMSGDIAIGRSWCEVH